MILYFQKFQSTIQLYDFPSAQILTTANMKRKTLKLKDALERHQGRDQEEKKKERQKKLQKDAEKKKRVKRAEQDVTGNTNGTDAKIEGGVLLNGDDTAIIVDDEDEVWSTDEEDDAEAVNLNRLMEGESDSESSDDELPTHTALKQALKSLPPKPISNLSSTAANDDDDPASESDIPLSDLPSDSDSASETDIIPHQRLTINNTVALQRALHSIALPLSTLPFSEHQSLTSTDPTSIPDTNDDLARELALYAQCLSAAQRARTLLAKESAPFTRPTDYFAEMVKSDEHMGKIKGKLTEDAAAKRASTDARKQRDLKKFGKRVQEERLKERARDKRDMLDKVNVLKRKRASGGTGDATGEEEMFDVALEDAATSEKRDRTVRRGATVKRGRDGREPNAKRAKKDEKFGFGGKKRFAKSGDAMSSADMSGFSTRRMKDQGSGRGRGSSRGGGRGGSRGSSRGGRGASRGGAAQRPGKARREKTR